MFDRFAADIEPIARRKKIFLVLPTLTPPGDMPLQMSKRSFFGQPTLDLQAADRTSVEDVAREVREALKHLAEKTRATIVDPLDHQCETTKCSLIDKAEKIMFKDPNHLRSSVVVRDYKFLDKYFRTETAK